MKKHHNSRNGNSGGFTVVEICVVLLLSGLMFAAFLSVYQSYYVSKNSRTTIENMDLAQQALREYFGLYGTYPRPARATAGPGDADYGLAVPIGAPVTACPAGVICTDIGARDANNDGAADRILIGVLPSRTLESMISLSEFKDFNGVDGFGMKLTYAVTEIMTRDDLFNVSRPVNVQLGAVAVKDENARDIIDPPDSAHYIILSHGENRRGGYSTDGRFSGDCSVIDIMTGLPGPAAPGMNVGTAGVQTEIENCDENDAIFINGLRSIADTDDYFDDILYFNTNSFSSLWMRSNFSPVGQAYIYNTNAGNVGVGTNAPTIKLDVAGDIRAQRQTEAENGYCDVAGEDCVMPENLDGTGMAKCPPGEVATSLQNNQLDCIPLFTAPISFTCPMGQYLTGFTNTGTPNCALPP